MSVQTTYSTEHNEAYAGMRADQQLNNAVSKLNKGADNIPFGKAIVSDGDDGGQIAVLDTSTAAQFIGVALRELNRAIEDGDVFGAVAGQDFSVVTHGVIWVTCIEAVTKDDPVYMRIGATGLGDFSNVVGATVTLGVLIPNAKFLRAAGAGDLVKISLGLGG